MSPEQARGKPRISARTSGPSACVLYEMLTGKTLFGGESVSDTLAAVLTREPDLALSHSPVRPLLRTCLEKDPKRRLRDIGDAWRLVEETPVAPGREWRTGAPRALDGGGRAGPHRRGARFHSIFQKRPRRRRWCASAFRRRRRARSANGWPSRPTGGISRSRAPGPTESGASGSIVRCA